MAYDLTAVLRLKDKMSAKMQKATRNIQKMNSMSDKANNGFKKMEKSAKATAAAIGKDFKKAYENAKPDNFFSGAKFAGAALTAGGVAGAGLFGAAAKSAIDFEDAFAGVRKTVDASEEEFAAIKQQIRDLTKVIPAAHEEIAGVVETAGQLGIEKASLMSFTETMINLGVATNMTAENAATSLARLANITQMPQSNFDRLGSTVVALGNNLATTESEIVEMGLRLAGAGHQVGLTESQILGFAGALSSVGIEADAGGSAFSKVMINIASEVATNGKSLNLFAKTAGMSVNKFKKAFKEDAAGAIISFVEGLGRIKKEGGNVFGVLDDLDLSEIRVRDALLRASGAGDLFKDSIKLGSKAWQENTALANEAAERYKTVKSQLQILKNYIKDISISLGELFLPIILKAGKSIKNLIGWINNLHPTFKSTIAWIGLLTTGFMLIAGPILMLIGFLPSIVAGFSTLGSILAFLVSPIGLVIAAVGGLIFAGVKLYQNWGIVKAKANELWTTVKTKILGAVTVIKEAFSSVGNVIKSKMTSAYQAIKDFANTVPGALAGLPNTIKSKFVDLFDAMKAWRDQRWTEIVGDFKVLGVHIIDAFEEIREGVKNKFKIAGANIKTSIDNAITAMKKMPARIKAGFKNTGNTILAWAKSIYSNTGTAFTRIKDDISNNFLNLPGAFKKVGSNIIASVKDWFSGIGKSEEIVQVGSNVVKGVAVGMVAEKQNMTDSLGKIIVDVMLFALSFAGVAILATGKEIIIRLASGMRKAVPAIYQVFLQLKLNIINAMNSAKDGFINAWASMKNSAINAIDTIIEDWNKLKEFLKHPIKGTVNIIKNARERNASVDGSHYHGIDYVPRNGYIAELHRGERVQTAQEAKESRQGGGKGLSLTIAKLADSIVIREDSDIEKIANALAVKILQAQEAGA